MNGNKLWECVLWYSEVSEGTRKDLLCADFVKFVKCEPFLAGGRVRNFGKEIFDNNNRKDPRSHHRLFSLKPVRRDMYLCQLYPILCML